MCIVSAILSQEVSIKLYIVASIDENFRCYNDALDYIIEQREKILRSQVVDERYTDAILDNMLSVPLYPYQKEGIRFAYKAGKAIIADEMGLGKTLQTAACCVAQRKAYNYNSQSVVTSTLLCL